MIRLEDRSKVPHDGIWAQDAEINAYQVVENAYVAWDLRITTLKGTKLQLWRRYAEFDRLRADIMDEVPDEYLSVPSLPPKSGNNNFDNKPFLLNRQDGLSYFVKCVFLNPYTARSQAIRRFIR